MSKKKLNSKKHKFKHVEASTVGTDSVSSVVSSDKLSSGEPVAASSASRERLVAVSAERTVRFAYVGRDVRRILSVAVVLFAFELLLYVAISRTGFGDVVYRAINF